ncbi:SufD family Fe-S cluster assembly protein [Candidatus Carsonella ruddii]
MDFGKIFTFPINSISNSNCLIEHEANIVKISQNELLLLKSRGFCTYQCYNILINNFCYEIIKNFL